MRTEMRRSPVALRRCLAASIRTATEPGAMLQRLMNGKRKALISFWHGQDENKDYEPSRGDGMTWFAGEDDETFCLRELEAPEHTNWWQGVPIWLLQTPPIRSGADMKRVLSGQGVVVRAYGLVHPLYNAATVDFYNADGYQMREFIFDPRLSDEEVKDIDLAAQFRALQDINAWIDVAQSWTPKWNPPCVRAGDHRGPFQLWR